MKVRQVLAVVCAVYFAATSVQAAPPTNVAEAISQINSDAVLLSGWLSDLFRRAAPFNSTSGNVVPSQVKLFPGFEVGVSAVGSATDSDEDAFHALGTQLIDTHEIDTFDTLPMPMILGHAKVGLPWGLDAGVRLGGIPSTDTDEGDTHMEISNTIVGLDLRKKLVEEGAAKPFGLTLGIDYTHAEGHITATTPYSSDVGNVTFTDAVGSARTEWNTDSVGLQVLMNKKILFMNPYIGASVNQNFGNIDTSITNTGTVTETGSGQSSSLAGTGGSAARDADTTDVRGLVGIEFTFLPFMRLHLGGEFANEKNMAGQLGLRVQFR